MAEKVLQKLLADLILTENGILDNQKITLKQFAPEYLLHKKQGMRPKSYHRAEGIINVHLVPILGKLFLFEITPEKLFTYQSRRLAKGVSNSTVNREVSVLKNMLNVAVEWRRLKTNPIRATKKLNEPPGRLRFLTLEEIHKLLACCPPPPHPLRDMVMVALTTGMRRGEILGLKWDYIRLENRLIILPITKNNTVRVLLMNIILYRILSEKPERTGYVFGDENGEHVGDIKRSFISACRKVGIPDFHFHDLRHNYDSPLAMRGVHIRAYRNCRAIKHWPRLSVIPTLLRNRHRMPKNQRLSTYKLMYVPYSLTRPDPRYEKSILAAIEGMRGIKYLLLRREFAILTKL